ncbi:MAG: hypothetical protein ACE5HT_14900 [Gemmatimonadales bacterium]
MNQDTQPFSKPAIAGIYFVAGLLLFFPIFDLITNTLPAQLGNVQWRYGFAGLLSGFLHTPLLGMLIATVAATFFRHRTVLQLLAAVSVVSAAALLIVMPLFILDVLELRASTPPERIAAFQAGALFALFKHFTAMIAFTLLGVGGFKTAAPMPGNRGSDKRRADAVLVQHRKGRRSHRQGGSSGE